METYVETYSGIPRGMQRFRDVQRGLLKSIVEGIDKKPGSGEYLEELEVKLHRGLHRNLHRGLHRGP